MNKSKIRRAIVEATDDAVEKALKYDVAGRKADLLAFVQLLDRIEGNYSVFLDAPWGAGKTFFVKEAAAILRNGNPNINEDRACDCENVGVDANIKFEKASSRLAIEANLVYPHLPIYFNAWECDYGDMPVESLIETLVDEFEELRGGEKIDPSLKACFQAVFEAITITNGIGELSLKEAFDGVRGDDVILPLRRDRLVRQKLKELLDEAMVERAERIELFIDELDRCRPVYAVKLLEAIKFLFDDDRLTVVFSVDYPMLARAVCGCYGESFDGEAYLSRFYDMRFRLPRVDADCQMKLGGYENRGNTQLWETARAVIKNGNMSLRDQLKYTDFITHYATEGSANEAQANNGSIYVRNIIGPLLLCCQYVDQDVLQSFLKCENEGFVSFFQLFEDIEPFINATNVLFEKADRLGYEHTQGLRDAFAFHICPEMVGLVYPSDRALCILDSNMSRASEDYRTMLHVLHLG